MAITSGRLLLWSPRILGILVSAFIGMFALDAFTHGRSFFEALPGFLVHLIPAFVLFTLVAASWRWAWIGGVAFIGLAAFYALMAKGHIDWMLAISGPLAVVGVLFLWSWFHHHELHAS